MSDLNQKKRERLLLLSGFIMGIIVGIAFAWFLSETILPLPYPKVAY